MRLDSTGRSYSKICADIRMPLFPREMQGFRYRLSTYRADKWTRDSWAGRSLAAVLRSDDVSMISAKFRQRNREWFSGHDLLQPFILILQ